jgi:O-antigen/teichoic acid export membrane protein
MGTGRNIIKNFASLVTADFLIKTIGFAVTVYLARKLDPGDFGILTFSLSIVNYLTFFTDPGLTTYGVKRIAQAPDEMAAHMNDIFTIRLWLTAAALALAAATAFLMPQPAVIKLMLLAYALSMVPQALSPAWIYQGLQKMEFVGAYNIVHSLTYAALIFAFVTSRAQLTLIPLFLTGAYLAASAAFLWPLLKRYSFRFRKVRMHEAVEAVKGSLPIGISTFLVVSVNWNMSTTLLGFLSGQDQVGYFGVAMKAALILMGAGTAFGITLFPVFSKYNRLARATSEKILFLSEKAVAIAGLPLIMGTVAAGAPLIALIFGPKYAMTGSVLNLIIPGAVLYVINNVYCIYLISDGRQVENLKISAVRAFTLIAASLFMIPRWGANGAAAAYTLTEFLTALIYTGALGAGPGREAGPLRVALKPLIASVLMYLLIYPIPQSAALLKVPAGVLAYAAVLLGIKGVRQDEIKKLLNYIGKKGETPAP